MMKARSERLRPFLVLAVLSATAAAPLALSSPPGQDAPPLEARIARVENGLLPQFVVAGAPLPVMTLSGRMAKMKTPGISVAVINGGAIEWAKGYGVTETGTATPVTPRTLFQAASISKPVEKKVVAVDAEALAALEGRYQLRPGRFLEVRLEGATLFVIDGDDKVELFPESDVRFFEMDEGHTLGFAKGPDGRATHMMIDGQIKAPRR
jgi:hypothetical protein